MRSDAGAGVIGIAGSDAPAPPIQAREQSQAEPPDPDPASEPEHPPVSTSGRIHVPRVLAEAPEPVSPMPESGVAPVDWASSKAASPVPPAPPADGGEPAAGVPPPPPAPQDAGFAGHLSSLDLETAPDSVAPAVHIPSKPLLASEALMEDLAPVEPARRDARTWCAAFGAGLLLVGTLPLLQLVPGGLRASLPWVVNGTIAIIASFTRVTYRQRAVAMVVLGFLSGLAALRMGDGVLLHAAGGAPWGLARFLAAIGIPAALLFRAQYRAYAGARVFLATALAMSLPFVAHTVIRLMHDGGSALVQVGAVAALLVVAASLTGFMGSETTGAGAYVGPCTIVVIAAELGVRGVAHGAAGPAALYTALSGAFAFGVAACLAALGLFQILAWRFAADARRIDLHRQPAEPEPKPDEEPGSDWTTRE